jgi:hypothetical protein
METSRVSDAFAGFFLAKACEVLPQRQHAFADRR